MRADLIESPRQCVRPKYILYVFRNNSVDLRDKIFYNQKSDHNTHAMNFSYNVIEIILYSVIEEATNVFPATAATVQAPYTDQNTPYSSIIIAIQLHVRVCIQFSSQHHRASYLCVFVCLFVCLFARSLACLLACFRHAVVNGRRTFARCQNAASG